MHRSRRLATPEVTATPEQLTKMGDLAASGGIHRIHMFAWRDLADIEAGGSEVHAAAVAALWARAGLDVTLRTSWAQGSPPRAVRDGYQVVRKAGRYLVFPRAVVAELAGRLGPRDALVEIWNGMPFLSPLWATGPRAVFLHHHHEKMWPLVLGPRLARMGSVFEQRVAPPLYRRTPIITLSESSRQELVAKMGLRPQQVHVVPPGIDPHFCPGGDRSPTPLVVAVGRLMPSKRFDRLIEHVDRVRHQIPGLRLVIVGEGYELDNLEALIRDLEADDWVELPGRVDDDELVSLYRQSWVVASSSISEGWGMTLTEAAACGTPAVATDIAGHRDAVVHGETGLLATSDDDFVVMLQRLLTDDAERQRLAEGALARAGTFTWEATARGALEVLVADALAKGHSPR
ncbi:MAG: glycosyltransferase family 4 protein [Acidimicrobiia bacterium]|nr:glycosyltransferase family 4 protein [Acidimicrobiia bacterium]